MHRILPQYLSFAKCEAGDKEARDQASGPVPDTDYWTNVTFYAFVAALAFQERLINGGWLWLRS